MHLQPNISRQMDLPGLTFNIMWGLGRSEKSSPKLCYYVIQVKKHHLVSMHTPSKHPAKYLIPAYSLQTRKRQFIISRPKHSYPTSCHINCPNSIRLRNSTINLSQRTNTQYHLGWFLRETIDGFEESQSRVGKLHWICILPFEKLSLLAKHHGPYPTCQWEGLSIT